MFVRLGWIWSVIATNHFGTEPEKEVVRQNIKAAIEPGVKYPLLLFPEGTVLGRPQCLLRFEKYIFGLGVPVVPVALHYYNPWPWVFYTPLTNFKKNLTWQFFLPCMLIHLEVLPPTVAANGEDAAAFSRRVQIEVADKLGIGTCSHNWAVQDTTWQALGIQGYDQRHWDKARKNVHDVRAEIMVRQTETKSRFTHPNKDFVLAQLKKSEKGLPQRKIKVRRVSQTGRMMT